MWKLFHNIWNNWAFILGKRLNYLPPPLLCHGRSFHDRYIHWRLFNLSLQKDNLQKDTNTLITIKTKTIDKQYPETKKTFIRWNWNNLRSWGPHNTSIFWIPIEVGKRGQIFIWFWLKSHGGRQKQLSRSLKQRQHWKQQQKCLNPIYSNES